jgi:hypothetical protein
MILAGFMNLLVKENTTETAEEIVEELMQSEKTPTTYI